MTNPATPVESPDTAPTQSRLQRLNPASRYLIVVVGLALIAIIAMLVAHAMTTEPRDAAVIADRELRLNVIAPDEHVFVAIPVSRRQATDYFRATHGELILTDRRMVFLGLRPRDLLSPADAPPAFDERDFPLDTLVSVTSGRAMAGLIRGVVVRTPTETMRLAVAGNSWPIAEKLLATIGSRRSQAQAQGVTQESMRKHADADWKQVVAAWKKPQIYTVRRGDALGGIATQWNTTPERLQALNHLPGNSIRVGQSLTVREGQ